MKNAHSFRVLIVLILIFLLGSCSQEKVESSDLMEIKGYVISKEMEQGILIVPNIDKATLEGVMNGKSDVEYLAYKNKGAYFYVSKEIYEGVNVGDQVFMKYKPGNTSDSDPPHVQAEVLEFTKQ